MAKTSSSNMKLNLTGDNFVKMHKKMIKTFKNL